MILNGYRENHCLYTQKGNQIRDWLYVDDHVRALLLVATKGNIGETYNIGGNNEKQNIEVVKTICKILEKIAPISESSLNISSYESLITFVKDRPGHDMRYAIDATKITNELGWKPKETFETGIYKTIIWYMNNKQWYKKYIAKKLANHNLINKFKFNLILIQFNGINKNKKKINIYLNIFINNIVVFNV